MIVGVIDKYIDKNTLILYDAMLVYQREVTNEADYNLLRKLGIPIEESVGLVNDYIPININPPFNEIYLYKNQVIFEFLAKNTEELDEFANTYFQKIPARPAGSREQTGGEGQGPSTDQTN
jgi:hypothetical protein